MATEMTGLSNIPTNLTAIERAAFMQGMIEAAADLQMFELTGARVANIDIDAWRTPAPWRINPTDDDDVATPKIRTGYNPVFTKVTMDNGVALGREVNAFTAQDVKLQLAAQMGQLYLQAIAQAATDYGINNAITLQLGDGKTLLANDHPSGVGSLDNLLGSALDQSAAETAEYMLREAVGYDGQKMGFVPTELVVPPRLKNTAMAIVAASDLHPTRGAYAYSTPNPLAGSMQVVVNPYIDSVTAWLIRDRRRAPLRLNVADPANPEWQPIPGKARAMQLVDAATIHVGWSQGWDGVVGYRT